MEAKSSSIKADSLL